MNFDDAIKSHSAWKLKLSAYLQKPDKSLNSSEIALDNKCELGKWIHGEGAKQYSNLPEFQTLKQEHAKFHKAASQVVVKADSGKSVSEDVQLGGNSEFSLSSNAVITSIMKLKTKIK